VTARLLLLRHARAGSKAAWTGDDRLRPLNPRGTAEADALIEVLGSFGPHQILSSPLTRCTQTVDPLANALGLDIEVTRALAPNANAAALALVRRLGASDRPPIVLCTHREVIERLQAKLGRRSGTSFGKRSARAKASTWILDWLDGELQSSTYLAPPRVAAAKAPTPADGTRATSRAEKR
jgi:8-oxo-dGTP diphosphatase